MVDQLAVARNIFQIADKAELEENHRVDALLAAVTIIPLGKRVKKTEVDGTVQSPVEIGFRNTIAQSEIVEEFLLIILFALHT